MPKVTETDTSKTEDVKQTKSSETTEATTPVSTEITKSETKKVETVTADDSSDDEPEGAFPRAYVENLRSENKKRRLENKELETRLNKLEESTTNRIIRGELKAAVIEAGIVELDALKMFDTSALSLTQDGEVAGVTELVNKMKEQKPYLFKPKVTNTTSGSRTPNAELSTENAKPITTVAEYKKSKAAFLETHKVR